MTLYELIENIKNLGKSEPNVSFVTQGDIYELNHQQDIDYPAFVVTQGTHFGSAENGVENYGLTLFLVDRLTSDKSNELDVQSWADTGLKNIISRIEEHNLGVIQGQYTVQTFTEKFDSLCAGAYVSLNIQVQVLECNCCENKIDLVTSVNGKTGDVIIKGYEGAIVYSVNGKTGDVVIDIPETKDYVSNTSVSANYAKKSDLNSYLLKKDYKEPDVKDFVTNTSVYNNYAKKTELNSYLLKKDYKEPDVKDFVTNTSVYNNYAKKTELNSYLLKKDYKEPDVDKSYVDVKISDLSVNIDNKYVSTNYVDSNFIKKGEVPTNVYTKDETYNRTEIDDKIQEHTSGVISVNGQTGIVTLDIPSLDGYATETYVEDNYLKKVDVPIIPTDYVHIEDFNQHIQEQAAIDSSQNTTIEAHGRNISELTNSLSDVYSKSDVNDLFADLDSSISSNYVKKGEIPATPTNVYTKSETDQKISEFLNDYYTKPETYTKSEVDKLIEDISVGGGGVKHVNITQADYDVLSEAEKMNGNIYCIIDAFNIDDFITTKKLETKLSGYVKTGTLDNYVKTEALNNYVTTATLNNYVTKGTLNNYVKTATLNNYVEKASFVYDSANKTLDIRIL